MSDGKYIYTEKEVRMMWQRSKPEQIQVAQAKCLEAIVRTGGAVSSFVQRRKRQRSIAVPHGADVVSVFIQRQAIAGFLLKHNK